MKVLITGAFGYAGGGLVKAFEGKHKLRLMSTRSGLETPHELFTGNVRDLDDCRKVVDGMDALVLCHMAVRQKGAYDTPVEAFDVNVKGTANLFFCAVEQKIKRVVLISSIGAVMGYPENTYYTRDLPPKGKDMYSLTKALQEHIAEHYYRVHGIGVAVLRVGWIIDADTMITKYNEKLPHSAEGLIDPRDIGEAARMCCERDELGYEVLYLAGTSETQQHCDVAYSERFLGWGPQFDFSHLPTMEEYDRQQAEKGQIVLK